MNGHISFWLRGGLGPKPERAQAWLRCLEGTDGCQFACHVAVSDCALPGGQLDVCCVAYSLIPRESAWETSTELLRDLEHLLKKTEFCAWGAGRGRQGWPLLRSQENLEYYDTLSPPNGIPLRLREVLELLSLID